MFKPELRVCHLELVLAGDARAQPRVVVERAGVEMCRGNLETIF